MKSPGIASWRFYNAFYRWSLLDQPAQPCGRALRNASPSIVRDYSSDASDDIQRHHERTEDACENRPRVFPRQVRKLFTAPPDRRTHTTRQEEQNKVRSLSTMADAPGDARGTNPRRAYSRPYEAKTGPIGHRLRRTVSRPNPREANKKAETGRNSGEHDMSSSKAPPESSQTSETTEKEDSEANESWFTELVHPRKISYDATEVWFQLDKAAYIEHRADIQKRFGCKIRFHNQWYRITGPRSAIEEARYAVQTMLDTMCDEQSIPRRPLQIIMPLTRVHSKERWAKSQTMMIGKFKTALRPLTSPVVLVIAALREASSGRPETSDQLRGVTVSSLTSVSLDEAPIISFNLRLPSRTWGAMESNNKISLSFLTATPDGAAIAHAFTQPHGDPSEPFRQLRRLHFEILLSPRDHAARLMKIGAGDVFQRTDPTVFCTMFADVMPRSCVRVADHMIVVAKVTRVISSNTTQHRAGTGEAFALAYSNRSYRIGGDVIEPTLIPDEEDNHQAVQLAKQSDLVQDADRERDPDEPDHHEPDQRLELGESPARTAWDEEILSGMQSAGLSNEILSIESENAASLLTEHSLDSIDEQPTLESLERMEGTASMDQHPTLAQDQFPSEGNPDRTISIDSYPRDTPPPAPKPQTKSSLGFAKQSWRSYSTSTRTSIKYEPTTNATNDLNSKISDSSLLSTTVGEYLNSHEEDPYIIRRMKALMKARKEVHDASRHLEWALKNGKLTASESKRLENVITRNER